MFNYLANQPDALDLTNRITNSRAQQLQNDIYAAQAPLIRAQTGYQLANTAFLPQQRDAQLLAAYARGITAPSQIYKNTLSVVPEALRAQSMADNSAKVQAINNAAFNMLSGGGNPIANQILQKYGMSVTPQQQGVYAPQGTLMPDAVNAQGQSSGIPASQSGMSNDIAIQSNPDFTDVAKSVAQQKSMTESQRNKLPFSQNLNVTLEAMKSNYKDAMDMAGSGLDIPTEYAKMVYNASPLSSIGGKKPLDPNFIKYKTYMDSVETLINQLRQTYGASIQPAQLEHFREMFTPDMIFDTPATARQKVEIAFNNIDNELKTFKQPVSNLISDQFTKQQQQDVAQGTKQIQQEALQRNAQVGNAMVANGRVKVISKDGKTGTVPASRLKEFLDPKQGYRLA